MPLAATDIRDKLSLGFADAKSHCGTDPLRDSAGGLSAPPPCLRTDLCGCAPPRERSGPALSPPWGAAHRGRHSAPHSRSWRTTSSSSRISYSGCKSPSHGGCETSSTVIELLSLHHRGLGCGILGDASAPGVLSRRSVAFTASGWPAGAWGHPSRPAASGVPQ